MLGEFEGEPGAPKRGREGAPQVLFPIFLQESIGDFGYGCKNLMAIYVCFLQILTQCVQKAVLGLNLTTLDFG